MLHSLTTRLKNIVRHLEYHFSINPPPARLTRHKNGTTRSTTPRVQIKYGSFCATFAARQLIVISGRFDFRAVSLLVINAGHGLHAFASESFCLLLIQRPDGITLEGYRISPRARMRASPTHCRRSQSLLHEAVLEFWNDLVSRKRGTAGALLDISLPICV